MSPNRKFQILALSGGGFRGLHIARLLEIIEEKTETRIARHFDLIAGTSVGGIIGLALAMEIPAKTIRETLENVGPRLFPKTPPEFPCARKLFNGQGTLRTLFNAFRDYKSLEGEAASTKSAWYDPTPLAEALRAPEYFGTRFIKDLLYPVIIPAVNYTDGLPKFFKTDHHSSFKFDRDLSLVDVALGTSAAPIYFPIHKVKDWRIVDGGLIANDPTQVAIHEAMKFFGIRPPLFGDTSTGQDDLRVLSIGTLSPRHFADINSPLDQGMIDWGPKVFDLAGSAQEAMSAVMVDRHMLPGRVIRLPSMESRPEQSPGMADSSAKSTEVLRASALSLAQEAFGRPDFCELFQHTGCTLADVRAREASRNFS